MFLSTQNAVLTTIPKNFRQKFAKILFEVPSWLKKLHYSTENFLNVSLDTKNAVSTILMKNFRQKSENDKKNFQKNIFLQNVPLDT